MTEVDLVAAGERYSEIALSIIGGMDGACWSTGALMGMHLATHHPEVAQSLLDGFFATPHTEQQATGFFTFIDYIVEGKEPG
jgi:hypothetical protein